MDGFIGASGCRNMGDITRYNETDNSKKKKKEKKMCYNTATI